MKNDNHIILEHNAKKIWEWLQAGRGLAIWESINLSNPGASWSTPARTKDGKPQDKPTWQAANAPARVIESMDQIDVSIPLEVKRFRIHTRMGAQGLMIKLTDASSRRVRAEVDKAKERSGRGAAWYEFDYDTQEAVIYVDDKIIPLAKYAESQGWEKGASDVGIA